MDEPVAELTSRHVLYLLVGVALMVSVGVLVAASGLIAPLWAVVLLWSTWIAGAVWSLLRWRERPFFPLAVAVAVGVVWVVVISVGNAFLGWRP